MPKTSNFFAVVKHEQWLVGFSHMNVSAERVAGRARVRACVHQLKRGRVKASGREGRGTVRLPACSPYL